MREDDEYSDTKKGDKERGEVPSLTTSIWNVSSSMEASSEKPQILKVKESVLLYG